MGHKQIEVRKHLVGQSLDKQFFIRGGRHESLKFMGAGNAGEEREDGFLRLLRIEEFEWSSHIVGKPLTVPAAEQRPFIGYLFFDRVLTGHEIDTLHSPRDRVVQGPDHLGVYAYSTRENRVHP